VCQNPAILTEKKFQDEVTKKAKKIIPLVELLGRLFPRLRIPSSLYVDWKAFPETEKEKEFFRKFMNDPNLVKWYTLRSALSQIQTPPPNPIEKLKIPVMIVAPTRDKLMSLTYIKGFYDRLPSIKKKLVEVDGGHWWMFSHLKETVEMICDWFEETL
jgi:surfactin synthase thioesterase subunit